MFNSAGNRDWRRLASQGLGVTLLVIVAFYGGQAIIPKTHSPVRLVVYAFSTQEGVLTQGIFPAFEEAWEAETGHDLIIEGIFGPSGTLAGQINLGAPADVAMLSNEQHVNWLKIGQRVRRETQPIVVSTTPMVIVVRPDNPMGIAEFSDLAQPGLRLLHADPHTSGAGDWAMLAEYGSALMESGDHAVAQAQLEAIWHNVRLLAPSARSALILFELGAGDALVTYEQDAHLSQARGVPLEIVVPPRTIVAHHVAVAVDANVTPTERPVVEAFLSFLLSDAGQETFTHYHLRPAKFESDRFPSLAEFFTVEELGGWSRAYDELVEDLWQTQIEPRLDLEPAHHLLDLRGD